MMMLQSKLLLIVVAFLMFFVVGGSAEAQQQVCCSETLSGGHCDYVDASECKPGALSASTSCEQTSFCKLGCGFDQGSGRCFSNTPKFSCETGGNCSWSPSPTCDIPQCTRGCCVLSNECSFTTQLQCKKTTSLFPDVEMSFKEEITNELECIDQCRSFERGACVDPDGSCIFTTRESCIERSEGNVNVTGPLTGFHPDRLCSNPQLGTECAPQQYTGCLPDRDEVYWFDSCGNAENIYDSSKIRSFNNGFVLEKEGSCNANGANLNNPDCGNCNYVQGTLCGLAGNEANPTIGDYACLDVSCGVNDVTEDTFSPASSSPKKLGESWCAYDSIPGGGQDPVGSRHYRRLCINGQELTEPCKDFREEMCVQGDAGVDPFPTAESFTLSGGDYLSGACRDNRWQDCDDVEDEFACNNVQQRDCLWLGKSVYQGAQVGDPILDDQAKKNKQGSCVPFVSPGLKFWTDESTGDTPDADAQATCERANNECTVVYEISGIGNSKKCIANCECENKNWLLAQNTLCVAQGDCGAWVNIKNKGTTHGFSVGNNHDFDITGRDLGKFGQTVFLSKHSAEYNNKFSAFFERSWIPLTYGVIAYSVVAWRVGFQTASAFVGPVQGTWLSTFGAKNTVLSSLGETATKEFSSPVHYNQIYAYVNTLMWVWMIYNLLDVFLADTDEITYSVTCNPWVAPVGGGDCESCGDDGKPCSEYRCKSLGQLCQLVNPGTEKELCINRHPNDVSSPVITADDGALEDGYTLSEQRGEGYSVSPLVEPFTAVSLGIETNEPAQCKYDVEHSKSFDEMTAFFGDGLYGYNHSILFSVPGEFAENEEILKLTNGGQFTVYIRCQDGSGNANDRDYYIKFAVKKGPDLTPPVIEVTGISNGAYISSGVNETYFTMYVNEPSTCKWDDLDTSFDAMLHDFSCSTQSMPTSSLYYGLYDCSTVLDGIQPNKENVYYFRCKDQPTKLESERNVNEQSYIFRLRGTVPLMITSVSPEPGTQFFIPSPELRVITSKGAQSGNAVCGYSFIDNEPSNAIEFFNTNSTVHTQVFANLTAGDYNVFITCIDIAGNIAQDETSFSVAVDTGGPKIAQLYTETNLLILVTDELSTCEYSATGFFTYGGGIQMTGVETTEHQTSLDNDVYYVVCQDIFGNEGRYTIFV
jgi:hypothetical protein